MVDTVALRHAFLCRLLLPSEDANAKNETVISFIKEKTKNEQKWPAGTIHTMNTSVCGKTTETPVTITVTD